MNQTPTRKEFGSTNRNNFSDKSEEVKKSIIKSSACGITVTPQAAKQEKSNSDSFHSLLDNYYRRKLQESAHSAHINPTLIPKESSPTDHNSFSDKSEEIRELIARLGACGVTVTLQPARQKEPEVHSQSATNNPVFTGKTEQSKTLQRPHLARQKESGSTDHNRFSYENEHIKKLIIKFAISDITTTRQLTRQKELEVHSQSVTNKPVFTGKIEQSKIFQRRHMARQTALLSEKLNKDFFPTSMHQTAQQKKSNSDNNIGINCIKGRYLTFLENKLESHDGEKKEETATFCFSCTPR